MDRDSEVGIYTTLPGEDGQNIRVGTLWFHHRRQASASFTYSGEWLQHPYSYELEPALPLGSGKFHTVPGQALFGAMSDSAPDRWGRTLIQRAHRKGLPGHAPVSGALGEQHYLLGVNDSARMGALRYSIDGGCNFMHSDEGAKIPPLLDLLPLQNAVDKICRNTASPDELLMLLNPASSLGGAWPKANVRHDDGSLYIAKFSHPQQEYDVIAWETVALTIAAEAGLNTPECRLQRLAKGKNVFLTRRFDRLLSGQRVPYISAMTLMQARDGESHSYPELAAHICQFAANPENSLVELWKRIALNIMITNVDDHPRNHGFLRRESKGWILSPLFDVNPTPEHVKGHTLSMDLREGDNTASLKLLCECAEDFYIRRSDANRLLRSIAEAVSHWRAIASRLGIPTSEQDDMSSAFEHPDGYGSVM